MRYLVLLVGQAVLASSSGAFSPLLASSHLMRKFAYRSEIARNMADDQEIQFALQQAETEKMDVEDQLRIVSRVLEADWNRISELLPHDSRDDPKSLTYATQSFESFWGGERRRRKELTAIGERISFLHAVRCENDALGGNRGNGTKVDGTTVRIFDASHLVSKPSDVVIPEETDPSPRPFICELDWAETGCQRILEQLDETGWHNELVAPISLISPMQGGKTRSLYKLAKKLKDEKPELGVIYVSFGGFSQLQGWEAHSLVDALCRRVACAALGDRDYFLSATQYKEFSYIDKQDVLAWLGDKPCVLLIDDMDETSFVNGGDEASLAAFLTDHFLLRQGRSLVYSSSSLMTNKELPPRSRQEVGFLQVPFALLTATEGPLTVSDRLYYGLVPGVIETRYSFPSKKQYAAVEQWLEGGIDDEDVVKLLKTFVTGKMGDVPPSILNQLMDVTVVGLARWIPFNMQFVLMELCKVETVSYELKKRVAHLARMFRRLRRVETRRGDGRVSFLALVVWLRVLTGQGCDLLNLEAALDKTPELAPTYNAPLAGDFDELVTLDAFLDAIPESMDGAHVAVYNPVAKSRELFDVLVVVWGEDGKKVSSVGYQAILGEASPLRDERICKGYAFWP